MIRRPILVALVLAAVAPASASADRDQDEARRAREAGRALPLDRILERARREHPGKLLGVELEEKKGRLIYELRVLGPGGRIDDWAYDARTGEPVPEFDEGPKRSRRND